MQAANTTTETTQHNAGFPPAPPEAHQRAELSAAAEYLASEGYSVEIKGDSVEVQDPVWSQRGDAPRRLLFEVRKVSSMRAAFRFIVARS